MLNKVMQAGVIVVICLGSSCGSFGSLSRKVHLVYHQAVAGVHSDRGGGIYVETPVCPGLKQSGDGSWVIGDVDHGGFGVMTGDAVTPDSVPKWIGDALCVELKAAGFTPEVVDKLPPTADRGICTRLVRVWVGVTTVDFVSVAMSEVRLRMALYQAGKVVREFDVEGSDGGAKKEKSLRIALETCMRKAVPLVVATLEEQAIRTPLQGLNPHRQPQMTKSELEIGE